MNITDKNSTYNFKGVSFCADGGSVNFHFMMETDEKPTRDTLKEFGQKYALTYMLNKKSTDKDTKDYGRYKKFKGVSNSETFEWVDDELELVTLSKHIRKYYNDLGEPKDKWYRQSSDMKWLRRLERLRNLLQ